MIFLTLFLGLVLRLISLNQSLWLDEATSALVSQMSFSEIFTKFLPGDFHPPLYYLILKLWSDVFGYSEISLRLPSVIFGVGTIYVTYLISKNLKWKHSIEASLLLATSGLHIYYSQEARMYSLAAFFMSLVMLFFVKSLREGRAGDFFFLGLFLTLSVLTDYLPILIVPTMLLVALTENKNFSWWKKYVTSHIIPLSAGLVWLPYFLKQFNSGLNVVSNSPAWTQILGQTNFKNLILIPTKFIFGRINIDATFEFILMVGIVFLVFGYLLFQSVKDFRKTRIVWLWFLMPVVLGTLVSFWIPTLSYFRFLFILPAFYLLASHSLNRVLFIILILFNLVTSSIYLFNSKNHREDWRSAVETIGTASIIFPAKSQREAIVYYNHDAKLVEVGNLTDQLEEIWLSRYVWEVFDPDDTVRKKIESLGYNKTQEFNFNGVVFYKYENSN